MDQVILDMIEFTNQAMLYELFTYPSFGLVSPYSKGSHQDMDHFTFIDSISVLNKYMYQMAKLGYSETPIESMYQKAVEIGLSCEQEMFQKTNGINTHKGLIFVLGTLVVSTMKALYEKSEFNSIFTNCKLLVSRKKEELSTLHEKQELSHGEKIFLKYHIEGVRKEAYLGFPIISKSLNLIDVFDKRSLVKTLIYIMSECEDTTIIHRHGIDELNRVKQLMKNLHENGCNDLEPIEEDFIKRGISPGGAADLLCGTIFLSLIKNKYYIRRV